MKHKATKWTLIMIMMVLIFTVTGCKQKQKELYARGEQYYQQAVAMVGKEEESIYDISNQFKRAISEFEALNRLDSDYLDVNERINSTRIALAITYLDYGEFEKAYEVLNPVQTDEGKKLINKCLEDWGNCILVEIEEKLKEDSISIPDLTLDLSVKKTLTGGDPFYTPVYWFASEIFDSFSDQKKLKAIQIIGSCSSYSCKLNSNGSTYYYDSDRNSQYLFKDKTMVIKQARNGGSSSGSSTGTCPLCHGSGLVKYYYGSSDLEAYLDGEAPYTVGKCTMCNGTGKVTNK